MVTSISFLLSVSVIFQLFYLNLVIARDSQPVKSTAYSRISVSAAVRMQDYESVLSMLKNSKLSPELKSYHRVNALFHLSKYSEVIDLIDDLDLNSLAPLMTKIKYFKAASLCRTGQSHEGIQVLDRIKNKENILVSKDSLLFLKAECLLTTENESEGKKILLELINSESEESESHEMALKMLAEIEKRKNSPEKKLAHEFTFKYPQNPVVDEIWTNLPADEFSDIEKISIIKHLFREREYEKMDKWYKLITEDSARKEVDYIQGVGLYRTRMNYEKALKHLLSASQGKDSDAAHAHYLSCITMAKLDQVDDAVKCCDDFFVKFPGDRRASEVAYQKARFAYSIKDYKNAIKYMEKFLAQYKKIPDRTKYYWFLGWFHFRAGNYDDAMIIFKEISRSDKTIVGDKARYWIGRIYEKQQKNHDAIKIYIQILIKYPYSYYSLLSSLRLKKMGHKLPSFMNEDFSKTAVLEEPDWNIFKNAKPEIKQVVKDLQMYIYAGEIDAATDLYNKNINLLKRASKNSMNFIQGIKQVLGQFKGARPAAFGAGDACTRKPITKKNLDCWRQIFPLAYRELAVHASQKYQFPEYLLYAHMLQESRYNPRAISGAPAYGLLQILKRTGRRIAHELNLEFTNSMLYKPEISVKFGCYYLSILTKEFQGQIPFASASYNGGPLLVREQMAKNIGLPFDELIEEIEAHQTRNYVRKVLEHFHRYLYLYASPQQRNKILSTLIPDPVNYESLGQVNY